MKTEWVAMSREELIAAFEQLLMQERAAEIKESVEAIKSAFYKLNTQEQGQEQSQEQVTDPLEVKLKSLIAQYRTLRDDQLAQQEREREANLKIKLQIIEELKELSESSETATHTFAKFRELQQRWRDVGHVPISNIKDIWERYHLYTENFYSVIKINRELRDLDLRKNLESKVTLCEAAEALLQIEDVVEALQKLQPLHDQWRETGPVEAEQKEVIWLRFKEATAIINRRHLEHFEGLKAQQTENLRLKEEICEVVEGLLNPIPDSHKAWTAASERLLEKQAEWKKIGFAPKRFNNIVFSRMRQACDDFFAAKRDFYTASKSDMDENLKLKEALCEAAEAVGANVESISTNEEWRGATDKLIEMQAQWKEIGQVPRRNAEPIWKRFRTACDVIFEAKAKHFASADSEQQENLKRKQELLVKMNQALSEGIGNVEAIKALQRQWSEIGFVPVKQKQKLQDEYKALVDKMFDSIRSGARERHIGAFKERVTSLKKGGDNSTKSERDRLTSRIKELSAEVIQLETNLGFFARSKGAEAMTAPIEKKIERAKRDIAEAKEKIKILDLAMRESKEVESKE